MTSTALIRTKALCIDTPAGRPLIRDLSLSLGHERVALIGRNGVGKSSLLRVLAGVRPVERGSLSSRVEPAYVEQELGAESIAKARSWLRARTCADWAVARDVLELGLELGPEELGVSPGEARKLALLAAKHSGSPLLLLDEPSEDLDEAGLAWLARWLPRWAGGALVVTHHRPLLRCFDAFFVVAESGCRVLTGSFDAVAEQLEREQVAHQRRYVEHLNVLVARERDHARILRRRARKKNVGRLHELDRCTSRMRLNDKRSGAQESQARVAKIREDRIAATRDWAKATRRALTVELPLALRSPTLEPDDGRPRVVLDGVGLSVDGRPLFAGVDLAIGRQRLAVLGPNGAGKTTLLEVMLGRRRPTSGSAWCAPERIGSIAQAASDWCTDASLFGLLLDHGDPTSIDHIAQRVVAHGFPLALAERPLRSLSPGERVRAALICLFARAPTVDVLILDEPTHALDFVGLAALQRALQDWTGGLVVVSHDHEFLDAIGVDQRVVL